MELAAEKKEPISFNQEDITNIENLFTNTRFAQVKDKALLRESLDDEEAFISKMLAIEKERNDLLKKVAKLEKDGSKGNK